MGSEPVLERRVHARLPPTSRGFEGFEYFVIEPDRRCGLVTAYGPSTSTAHELVPDIFVRLLKKFVGQLRRVVRINSLGMRSAFAHGHLLCDG